MLLLASFLSGAAGLVFELLWAKRLGLLFGSAAAAQAAVLAAFLGGLALGSRLLGARADAAPSPLRYYAKLEAAVALFGVLAPALLSLASGPLRLLAPAGVLFHAFLMGGAIPALCRAAGGDAQRGLGRLYAANAAGASLGVLGAAFVAIPRLGLGYAGFGCGAALNVLAGLAALAAARPVPAAPAALPARPAPATPLPAALVLWVALASGAAALVYETAWTRLLALVLGGSTYSFAEMLAALIGGLAVGGAYAASAGMRRRDSALSLGAVCMGAGLAVLLSLPLAPLLPYEFVRLRVAWPDAGFLTFEAFKFAVCALFLLVPAAALGAVPALSARLLDEDEAGRGERVGELLAANALGNALGAAAGLWLLPRAGVEGALRAAAAAHLLCGAVVLWRARPSRRAAWVALAAGWGLAAFLPAWDTRYFARGVYRGRPVDHADFKDFKAYHREVQVLYHRDDREATVHVLRYGNDQVSLNVNGKADASTGNDMETQVLVGSLPLLLRPGARSALIIGWGSGVSAGSALRHPVPRVDVVELIPAVLEGSRWFEHVNGLPFSDPRLSVAVQDAKTFLSAPGPLYDVIASEPSNPWMAGIADLFSTEFYARARERLAPGGLFVQWFHLYEMDDEGFRLVLRTLRSAFPHVTIWRGSSGDALLVGSDRRLDIDPAAFERAYLHPEVWRDLARIDIDAPTALLERQCASEETAAALAGEGPLNSELRPLLEYSAPRAFHRRDRVLSLRAADDRDSREGRARLLLAEYLRERGRPLQPRELREWAANFRGAELSPGADLVFEEWRRLYPKDPDYESARKLVLGR